jgi:hypothetical protein
LYFWGGQIVFWGGQIVFWGGQIVFWGGRDAHSTRKFSDCGTGILPVLKRRLYFWGGILYFGAGETPTPQENLVIVEQASCLFLREDCIFGGHIVFWGGRDAHPTRKFSDCGTGILPILKRRLYFWGAYCILGRARRPPHKKI